MCLTHTSITFRKARSHLASRLTLHDTDWRPRHGDCPMKRLGQQSQRLAVLLKHLNPAEELEAVKEAIARSSTAVMASVFEPVPQASTVG